MTRNWAAFDRTSNPRGTTEGFFSIESKGTGRFNAPVYDALGRPEYIELLWDQDGHAIGLRPADATLPWAFRVRKHAQAVSFIISIMSFCKYHGIDLSETRRYRTSTEDGVVVVDLDQHPARTARARNRTDGPEATQGNLLGLPGVR